MTGEAPPPVVLAGYDGSPGAARAIEVGAELLPDASVHIAHAWTPPFAGGELIARLSNRARSLDELVSLAEAEAAAQAEKLAADGVALAAAAGWRAEAVVHRGYGDPGLELARLAERLGADVLVVGSRGLSGVRAVLGSAADAAVHHSPVPVLVVPQPLLAEERAAVAAGPVVVGHDGSPGAVRALAVASALFAGRPLVAAHVGERADGDNPAPAPAAPPVETVELEAQRGLPSGRAIADALAACAAERGAAVVVVGSRGRSPARAILMGSVAMATLHRADRPVLVVPAPDRFAGRDEAA